MLKKCLKDIFLPIKPIVHVVIDIRESFKRNSCRNPPKNPSRANLDAE